MINPYGYLLHSFQGVVEFSFDKPKPTVGCTVVPLYHGHNMRQAYEDGYQSCYYDLGTSRTGNAGPLDSLCEEAWVQSYTFKSTENNEQ